MHWLRKLTQEPPDNESYKSVASLFLGLAGIAFVVWLSVNMLIIALNELQVRWALAQFGKLATAKVTETTDQHSNHYLTYRFEAIDTFGGIKKMVVMTPIGFTKRLLGQRLTQVNILYDPAKPDILREDGGIDHIILAVLAFLMNSGSLYLISFHIRLLLNKKLLPQS